MRGRAEAAVPAGIIDVHAHYCSPRVARQLGAPGAHLPSGVNDLGRREEWMHERGIDLQLLGPELAYADSRLRVDEGVRRARLVNDATAADVGNRPAFVPLAMVPLPSAERAAVELRRAVRELGFRGAMIPSQVRGGLARRRLDALWECAADLRVPIMIHSGRPLRDPRLARLGLEQQVGRVHEVTVAAVELIFGGVLDRFSALRLVLAMGGGCLAQLAPRLDRLHALSTEPVPTEAPSTYLRRFVYDSAVLDGIRLRQLVEIVGAERVAVGTDWPFPVYDDDPAGSVRAAAPFERERVLIARGTAAALFGLA